MNNNNPARSYQQATARGTTPVGQVVALYDTILRDFARALAALQGGNTETRVDELNHALLVVAHLQNVLDLERGGDAAKQFAQFYNVTRAMIVQANIDASAGSLEQLIDLYASLRQAWHQVDTALPDQKPKEQTRTLQTPAPDPGAEPPSSDAEMKTLQWNA